jgi:hypothetical protein
VDAN